MIYARYKAGPWYDGSSPGRQPWRGTTEVNEAGLWRDSAYSEWQRFDGVTLNELVAQGYWQLEIPEELRVSEGL